MFNIKNNPYQLLLLTAIVLLFTLLFSPMAKMDFQDLKMFNIPLATMLWIIPLLLISLWLLYGFTNRFLYSTAITWIHVFITVLITILILIVLFVSINPPQGITENHETIGSLMQILSLIFILAQLIYLANVLLGLLMPKKIWINDKST
jgi:hypothetical protein